MKSSTLRNSGFLFGLVSVAALVILGLGLAFPPCHGFQEEDALTDPLTDLMWQQADDGVERTWEEAVRYGNELNLGGYGDWRLPRAGELLLLPADLQRPGKVYWSGSTVPADLEQAQTYAGLDAGLRPRKKSQTALVRYRPGWPLRLL
ncbi:MAG: DUF1566 domain-containing protein [Deltaproteobacteria bacterium]|nr:DUF1566 domain-containing protein [Deltaproteobacteria bacterium]